MSQAVASGGTSNVAVPCPRCKQPLIDPKGLGWCKVCGYCRSLAEGEKHTAGMSEGKPAAPQNTVEATTAAVGQMPLWIWVTLVGIATIGGSGYWVGHHLALTPFHSALLTTLSIGVGVLMMFIGQFIGVLRIAPEESTLGFFDVIVPFKLYALVMKRLPSSQLTFYLGVWGLTAIISANVFVGGLGHWLTYLPKSRNGPKIEYFDGK
jgi:hypothetical protein